MSPKPHGPKPHGPKPLEDARPLRRPFGNEKPFNRRAARRFRPADRQKEPIDSLWTNATCDWASPPLPSDRLSTADLRCLARISNSCRSPERRWRGRKGRRPTPTSRSGTPKPIDFGVKDEVKDEVRVRIRTGNYLLVVQFIEPIWSYDRVRVAN